MAPLYNVSRTQGACGTHISDRAFDWNRPRSLGVLVPNKGLFSTKVASLLQAFHRPCASGDTPEESRCRNLTEVWVNDAGSSIPVKINIIIIIIIITIIIIIIVSSCVFK